MEKYQRLVKVMWVDKMVNNFVIDMRIANMTNN